jgi:Ca-activated chloride channel family protein
MEMIRFENIDYLYGLAGVPVILALYLFHRLWIRRKMSALGNRAMVSSLIPNSSGFKAGLKIFIGILAYSSIVIGLANPQIGSKLEEITREGVELIVCVDLSNSMLSEDIKPNRLERAKRSIGKLIDYLRDDKVGLVVFAGKAFLQLPLTTDYSAAKLITSTLSPDLINTQGTAMGAAIELAMESFSGDETKNKAIIIITDGENHEDDALGAAKKAAEKGILIHTIGMGTREGGPIPKYSGSKLAGYYKDASGNTVVSKLNEGMLQQIAITGEGEFVRSSTRDADLTRLVDDLSKLEKTEFGTTRYTDYEDRFQYFIAAALILLLFEILLSERKNKYLSSLKKFAEGR